MIGRPGSGGVPARAMNGAVAFAVGRLGVPLPRVWMLRTTGRRSGRPREVPVLVMPLGGRLYLVAPRGRTRWSANLEAQPHCGLLRGGRSRPMTAVRAEPAEAAAVIGAYLRRYGWLTRRLFPAPRRPSPMELAGLAAGHPVWELRPAGA